jgi:hypothetical protein
MFGAYAASLKEAMLELAKRRFILQDSCGCGHWNSQAFHYSSQVSSFS